MQPMRFIFLNRLLFGYILNCYNETTIPESWERFIFLNKKGNPVLCCSGDIGDENKIKACRLDGYKKNKN